MADDLIRNNHAGSQPGDRLKPRNENPPGIVRIVQWPTLEAEIEGVARYVQHLVGDLAVSLSEILILSPRRLIGYGIRDALRGVAIPTHSFYHEEALEPENAQEAFALLTLLANQDDRVAQRFLLGLDSPSWRSGAYRNLRAHCEVMGCSPFEALRSFEEGVAPPPRIGQLRERYRSVVERLAELQGLQGTGLIRSLFSENESWAEPVREIASIEIEEADTPPEVFDKLRTAITQPEMPESGDFVRVMSLHKSKGLTSRVVIIAGMVAGLMPFFDFDRTPAEQDALMREQRRLFYVAITRPTERLLISSALQIDPAIAYRIGARVRANGRVYASQFLHELGQSAPAAIAGVAWREGGFQ
jgi:superfamily I DNA/RNA helicase